MDAEQSIPPQATRSAPGISPEAVGLPSALIKTLNKSVRNETSALALHPAHDPQPADHGGPPVRGAGVAAPPHPRGPQGIGHDRERRPCAAARRPPETTLVSMVPVGLKANESHLASASGGNALGSVMVKLGTDLAYPADRLQSVHESMLDGKRVVAEMTPVPILAMSALGRAPAIVRPMLKLSGFVKPPHLVISNVPGPRTIR